MKIDYSRVETWLAFGFILMIFALVISLKVGGTFNPQTNEPSLNGYCKITYGETSTYSNTDSSCITNGVHKKINLDDVSNVCHRVKFFETTFFNNCFHADSN